MLTDLQKRKFSRMFHSLDADHGGYLDYADFEGLFNNIVKMSGMAAGSAEYQKLEANYHTRWDHLRAFADTDRDDRVTLDEWLAYCGDLVQSPEKLEEDIISVAKENVMLADRDHDGRISREEFLGIRATVDTEKEAVFQRLDRDGDGHISSDEVTQAFREFFMSDDPNAPGNFFFGPY